MIHFHSSDERFCGCEEKPRRFSPFDEDVDCPDCLENDTLELTEQGKQMVALWERATEQKA